MREGRYGGRERGRERWTERGIEREGGDRGERGGR